MQPLLQAALEREQLAATLETGGPVHDNALPFDELMQACDDEVAVRANATVRKKARMNARVQGFLKGA